MTGVMTAQSHLRVSGQEAVDAIDGAGQGRIGKAMLLRVPEMDTRLIAGLDFGIKARQAALECLDHKILGLP